MSRSIDHIAIAVEDIDKAIERFESVLGSKMMAREKVESEEVEVVFFEIGGVRIELLTPLSEDSVVSKFIQRKGEGIHHIAISVEDIKREMVTLKENNIRLVDEEPRVGAMGRMVAFIHPESTHRVLFELIESSSESEKNE